MIKTIVQEPARLCVGITVRTNNAHEANPATAKIPATWQKFGKYKEITGNSLNGSAHPTQDQKAHDQITAYHKEGVLDFIPHLKNPGTLYSVYTDYASDAQGDYTYFLGAEVTSFDGIGKDLVTLTIPAQSTVKITSQPGPMPGVVIDMWKHIWAQSAEELGGERAYISDYEVYDERSREPGLSIVDIHIGIKA